MRSDKSAAVTEGWKPWGEIWNKAIYVGEMCNSIYKPWHFPCIDRVNIEVQKALTGQITADQCCDTLNTIRMRIVINACESGFG